MTDPSSSPCNFGFCLAKKTSSARAAVALAYPCVKMTWIAAALNSDALEACSGAFREAAADVQVSAWVGANCTALAVPHWPLRNCCVAVTVTAEVFDMVDPRTWQEDLVCAFHGHMAHSWVVGAFLEREPLGALVDAEEAPEKHLVAAATVQSRRKVPSFFRVV